MSAPSTIMTRIALLATIIFLQASAIAQPLWTFQNTRNAVAVEVLKGSLADGDTYRSATGTAYVSGRYGLAASMLLEAELPITHVERNSSYGIVGQTALGNPYVGLLFVGSPRFVGRAGFRIPLASGDDRGTLSMGALVDYDRVEAFTADVLSASGSFGLRHTLGQETSMEWGIGPVFWFHVRDTGCRSSYCNVGYAYDDFEAMAQYRIQMNYDKPKFALGAGFTGRAWLTDQNSTMADKTTHQITLLAIAHLSAVHPGLYLRLPIDDNLESLNHTFGFNVTFDLSGR